MSNKNTFRDFVRELNELAGMPIVQIFIGAITTIAGALIAFAIKTSTDIEHIRTTTDNLEKQIDHCVSTEYFEERTTNIKKSVDKLGDVSGRIIVLEEQVKNLYSINGLASDSYIPSSAMKDAIIETFSNLDRHNSTPTISITGETIIVSNPTTGVQSSSRELAGAKLLLPFDDNGADAYFYGQLNERGAWDGNCIINAYSHGNLVLITDALYNNGKLLKYRQVFPYTSNLGRDVWSISTRSVMPSGDRQGETYTYFQEDNYKQKFDSDSITANDILSVEDFEKELLSEHTQLEGYYFGYSYDGEFNDGTGKAYLIKYNKNGTVKLLYSGMFRNGHFHDQTGNAWEFIQSESGNGYYFYQGKFENGIATGREEDWEKDISHYRISDILDGKKFNCPLTGLE